MNALPPTQPTTKSGIDAGLAFHQPMLASPDPQAMLPSERIAATMGDRNRVPHSAVRFDVVTIVLRVGRPLVHHIENAF